MRHSNNLHQEHAERFLVDHNILPLPSECIKLCNDILEGELLDEAALAPPKFPKPMEIRDYLDQYVIEQDDANGGVFAAGSASDALDVNRAVQHATGAALRAVQVVNRVAGTEG